MHCERRCATSPNARSCQTSTSGSAPATCLARFTARPVTPVCSAPSFPSVGGGDGDGVDSVIICEELHYAGTPGGVCASLFTCGISVPHMIASGDQRLIDTYVRPTLRGELIGAWRSPNPAAAPTSGT